MERTFLSLGSNLGDREQNLRQGLQALCEKSGCQVVAKSAIYQTPPFGDVPQDDFYNAVVEVRDVPIPGVFLDHIHAAEAALGRRRLVHWGPRTLDIDLLAMGRREIKTTRLTVPHIGIPYRHFVLIPWAELAPEFFIPGVGTVAEALDFLPPARDIQLVKREW